MPTTKFKPAKRGVKIKSEPQAQNIIQNCNFTGSLDGETCRTIQVIAAGLQENAKALGLLANAFQPAPMMNIEIAKE